MVGPWIDITFAFCLHVPVTLRVECPSVRMAVIGPRRAAIRRYFAERYVCLLWHAESAGVPSVALRHLSPGGMCADLTRPADSLASGQMPAHDAGRLRVSRTVMSAPISAMISSATRASSKAREETPVRSETTVESFKLEPSRNFCQLQLVTDRCLQLALTGDGNGMTGGCK